MSFSNHPYVSIILPAFNEEGAICQVIQDIHLAMKQTSFSYEVLVIDDHSSDRTASLAANENVKLIKQAARFGAGAARKIGIQEARGEILVTLDVDGTYETSDIPKMLSYFPDVDQVNGARQTEHGKLRFLRSATKTYLRILAGLLFNTKILDLNTGLKAFKKKKMAPFLWIIPDGFSCVTTMTLVFLANGLEVAYMPTPYYKRIGKSKFNPIQDGFQCFVSILRVFYYFRLLPILKKKPLFCS